MSLFQTGPDTRRDRVEDGPLVSVIIPTYYRNDVLPSAIQSVAKQTYGNIETVVVDDSGDGHARPVVERFDDVRYVELDANYGVNVARTVGVEYGCGQYIHLLDDDDQLHEEKIARQMAIFTRNQDVGVVYSGIERSDGTTVLPDPDGRGNVVQKALTFDMWPCMTSTMLIDREVLETLLPFPTRWGAVDLEYMILLALRTTFDYVDTPLVHKRTEDESLGDSRAAIRGRLEIIEEYGDLYDAFPDWVHRAALATTYETKGEILLKQNVWSLPAIAAFLRYYWYVPNRNATALAKVVAATFGRPGWRVVRFIGHRT